jgi:hypothetical protein
MLVAMPWAFSSVVGRGVIFQGNEVGRGVLLARHSARMPH